MKKGYGVGFRFGALLLAGFVMTAAMAAGGAEIKPRNLYLDTAIVGAGKPALEIVTPASGEFDQLARSIVDAVRKKTGVTLPVVRDDRPAAERLASHHLLLLGNRDDNAAVAELYDQYYCILDLDYPGRGGHVVRTLHNPFNTGRNVILAGGSDADGHRAAVKALLEKIAKLPDAAGALTVGRLMEIKLGAGIKVPADAKDARIMERSRGYGDFGYFGWNSLSKNLALYYMTGDEKFAREFLRLAFPDRAAQKYLEDIDKEMAENKQDPIGGPYHYGAMMMILYWDMVEESPVFSAADRENVHKAFLRQKDYFKKAHYKIFSITAPSDRVGDRHAQWEALSVYALCRYLDKYYPDADSAAGLNGAKNFFGSLDDGSTNVFGEGGSMFWRSTSIEPVFNYVLLSGNRKPLRNGVLKKLGDGQAMLFNGRPDDWAIRFAATGCMRKMAYLLDDNTFLRAAAATALKTDALILGQSFRPAGSYRRDTLVEQAGKWSFEPVFNKAYRPVAGKIFSYGVYRSEAGPGGDYVLIDGSFESGRNLYHCLAFLELRLGGNPLLAGHHNQIYFYNDAMDGKKIPRHTELLHSGVAGDAVFFRGMIADYSGYRIDRTLLFRRGGAAVFADTVTALMPAADASLDVMWEFAAGVNAKLLPSGEIEAVTSGAGKPKYRLSGGGRFAVELVKTKPDSSYDTSGDCPKMSFSGTFVKGEPQTLFTVLTPVSGNGTGSVAAEYGDGLVALLPEPTLIAKKGDTLTASSPGNYSAVGFTGADQLGKAALPVDLDWNFVSGKLTVSCAAATVVEFEVADPAKVAAGKTTAIERGANAVKIALPPGVTELSGAQPSPAWLAAVKTELDKALPALAAATAKKAAAARRDLPELPRLWSTGKAGSPVAEIAPFPASNAFCAAAVGDTVKLIDAAGKTRELKTRGEIGVLHWWPAAKLLISGTKNDQVAAWGLDGKQKWEFTSLMAPEVAKTGKFYWFKDPKYYPGIWGLASGTFQNGREQLFVGGACTLEILDDRGRLAARIPEFWGPLTMFALIPKPDGSIDLASGKGYTGLAEFSILNSRKVDKDAVTEKYSRLPANFDRIGGWLFVHNTAIFCEDLDGDGKKEVISSLNGSWNWLVVWSIDGTPQAAANLGSGEKVDFIYPSKRTYKVSNIKDMKVADLYGDGKRQMVTALARNLVLCSDAKLRNVWLVKTDAPPQAVAAVPAAGGRPGCVYAALADGEVIKIDGSGRVVGRAQIGTRATALQVIGELLLAGGEDGSITAFKL